ncbi:MAG: hypothetical protein ABI183_06485 [Polyangiaceae bacterium]
MASTRRLPERRGALRTGLILGVLAIGVSTAAIGACVGDDPGGATGNDDGGSDATNGGDVVTSSDGSNGNDSSAPDGSVATVLEVSSGFNNACAVLSDGSVWCWGGDDLGQLGVASASLATIASCAGPCSPTPIQINFPTGIKITHVAAGNHSCAIDTLGDLYCWGENASGELGHASGASGDAHCSPSNEECNIAPQKAAGLADVVKVTIGSADTCALTTSHTVYCWGANYTLALGNSGETDAAIDNPIPTAVSVLGGKTIIDIDMAKNAPQACAIAQGEGVYCWGYNDFAQLGHATGAGTPADMPVLGGGLANATPQLVSNTPYATNIATAQWVSCASASDDAGHGAGCWGSNFHGTVGNGTFTTVNGVGTPLTQAAGAQSNIATIVGGGGGSSAVFCTVSLDSHLACWGLTGFGEVGNGMFYPADGGSFDAGLFCNDAYCVDSPQALPMLTKQVSVGYAQALALGTDGKVYAWGLNHYGQLGHAPATAGDKTACTTGFVSGDAVGPCDPLPTVVTVP